MAEKSKIPKGEEKFRAGLIVGICGGFVGSFFSSALFEYLVTSTTPEWVRGVLLITAGLSFLYLIRIIAYGRFFPGNLNQNIENLFMKFKHRELSRNWINGLTLLGISLTANGILQSSPALDEFSKVSLFVITILLFILGIYELTASD
jgi:hypothetical protein